MAKHRYFRSLFLLFAVLSLVACSKYEEGGASLASKKSRLVNHWKTLQITWNGYDITGLNIITDVEFTNNNTLIINGKPDGEPQQSTGKWVFSNDKKNVLITNSDGSLDSYEIIMLQKDECKFRHNSSNGDQYFYHFVPF